MNNPFHDINKNYLISYKIREKRLNKHIERAFDVYDPKSNEKLARVYINNKGDKKSVYIERKDMNFCTLIKRKEKIDGDDIDYICNKIVYC